MKFRSVYLLCIGALLGFAGCASFDPEIVRQKSSGKNIEIVVGVPTDLSLKWVGTTVFNNESGREQLGALNVSTVIGEMASALLKDAERYPSISVGSTTVKPPEEMVKDVTSSADLVLLVFPCAVPDALFQSNQFYSGVGLMQRSLFGLMPRTAMHAVLCGDLVDSASKLSLAKAESASYQRIEFPYLNPGPAIKEEYKSTIADAMPFHIRAALSGLLIRLGLR